MTSTYLCLIIQPHKKMAKFTLHNENGDFMSDSARTLKSAIKKCNEVKYKCKVYESYFAESIWDKKVVEHGKEVYRNY